MRRVKLVLAVAAVMVAMLVAFSGPAMAGNGHHNGFHNNGFFNSFDNDDDNGLILLSIDSDFDDLDFNDDGDFEFDDDFDLDLDFD